MALSMILLSLLLASTYVVALFVISTRVLHKRHRNASLPPGPLGLPLIGSALYFLRVARDNGHRSFAHLNETYGPIACFWVGMARPFVVVSSPAAARETLAMNNQGVATRWVPDSLRALGHDQRSIVSLPSSSPLWKQHRATISTLISSGRSLEMTRHIRDRLARQLAMVVRASGGKPIAVGEAVFGATVNAVSNMLFSTDLVDLMSKREEKGTGQQPHQQYKGIIRAINQGLGRHNISDAFPFLAPLDLFGTRRSLSRNMAELYKIFDEKLIETRLASGGSANHGDLLDVVLARHANLEMTRADISSLFTDIFIAGTETSAITVEWAMARLLRHPDKLAKVRAELAASVGDSKEFLEDSDVVGKLPYLHAVVNETWRLHPPVPLVSRDVVAEEGMSLGGFGLPKGTHILVNLWALGRDPTAWPEPEEFVPERFLDDDDDKPVKNFRGSDFAYIPFGAGRRVCPGMDLAARFVPLLLASLLHRVEWKLPDGMVPEDVDLREHFATVLGLVTPLRAIPLTVMSTQ